MGGMELRRHPGRVQVGAEGGEIQVAQRSFTAFGAAVHGLQVARPPVIHGGVAAGLRPYTETAQVLQARSLRPYKGAWRVKRVAFGAADYAHELGLTVSLEETELAEARSRVVLASRAAGLEGPIDSPWFHFKEADGFARALERSRRGGFQGRLCVHPDQIAPVNAAYLPSDAELARAERIVAAFRQAEARGEAAIQVDGQMIDYPVAHRAQALLDSVKKSS